MKVGFIATNRLSAEGKPAGGTVVGTGLTIVWQDGPLGRGSDRKAPNGAFVEDVIDSARQRIAHYQEGEFACEDNAEALGHLTKALDCLDRRTRERESRAVEGTHTP